MAPAARCGQVSLRLLRRLRRRNKGTITWGRLASSRVRDGSPPFRLRMTSRVDTLVEASREHLQRVSPHDLAGEVAAGAVVVDIRPIENRQAEGEMPGAVVIDRNVLEWRLDPTSDHRLPFASDEARVILFCNDGYASSLAAATLQKLGVPRATDLDGGYRAWRRLGATGLP